MSSRRRFDPGPRYMEVTIAQADALKLLRWSGWELSNLRPFRRAVMADTLRYGERGTVVIAPAGSSSHDLTPELLGQRAS